VTEAFVGEMWPDTRVDDAIGRAFRVSREGTPYEVVGVVENYKVDTPGESPKPYIHLPLARDMQFANFLVRTSAAAAPSVPALERELRMLDPDLVFLETGTLRDLVNVRLFPVLAGAWLIGAFGVLALLLAAVGLYGVIAYSVSRRVREIGIRKALGAESREVVGMVLRSGMIMVGVGGVIGAIIAVAGAQVMSSVMFVGAFDIISFLIAFAILAAVAALANALPARRASRVDPMDALRGR
jgi:predicted lysophospholipase L1 biosynthesis ABC-type transport system permease subunit